MGRWSYSNKAEADNLRKIQIWKLKKWGYLDGDAWKSGLLTWTNQSSGSENSIGITSTAHNGGAYMQLTYTCTDRDSEKKTYMDYRVELTTTACNYGKQRYWFICPLFKNRVYCGKRVGVLYQRGQYFGCRHCHDLTYSSKNENRSYRRNPVFVGMKALFDADELRNKMKRRYYAGKPTKKQRKLERLERGAYINSRLL